VLGQTFISVGQFLQFSASSCFQFQQNAVHVHTSSLHVLHVSHRSIILFQHSQFHSHRSQIPFTLRSVCSGLARKGQLSKLHIQKCFSYSVLSTFSHTTNLQSSLSFVTSPNRFGIPSQSTSPSYTSGIQSLSKSHFNQENKESILSSFSAV
jgi:hypothetical protein